MTSEKEVLTFQFGNYSNYVGTHFWNLVYDSLLSSDGNSQDATFLKLFRETSDKSQAYVPRMICFDEKSKLNALKLDGTFNSKEGSLNDPVNSSYENLCDDDHVLYKQSEAKKNDFLLHPHSSKSVNDAIDSNLDDKISSWSDYMSYNLNQNSLQLLRNRFEDESKFLYHGAGCSAYKQIRDDFEDKLHFWMEECNSLDGIMILSDINNGFCGLSSEILTDLQDDYKNKTYLPYINCLPTKDDSNDIYHWLNIALTFQSYYKYSSLFVLQSLNSGLVGNNIKDTINIPNVLYKADSPYHKSAILANAINSSTLPWRKTNKSEMFEVCQNVSQGRWKLAGNAIGFPLAIDSNDVSLSRRMLSMEDLYGTFLTTIFPLGSASFDKPLTQSIVFQDNYGFSVPKFDNKMMQSYGVNQNMFFGNPQRFLDYCIGQRYPTDRTVSSVYLKKENSNFINPISSMVNIDNQSDATTMSSLFTSSSFHHVISEVISRVQRMDLKKLHLVEEYGLNNDSLAELLEDLMSLSEEYNLIGFS